MKKGKRKTQNNYRTNQLYRKAIAHDKMEVNFANSTIICLLGYFCMIIHICGENSSKSKFSLKMQKNRKMSNFGNFC